MMIIPAVMINAIQSPFRVVNFLTAFFLPFPSEKVFMELLLRGRASGSALEKQGQHGS
ncbi:MAG TPA: hypothetical protein VGK96_10545 [Candidatus Sulfotelmatobacter sp.]|jgi:membrane protein YqaA with SNARE-associated domain